MPDIHKSSTRTTSQRLQIFEILRKSQSHLSAEEIYQQAKKTLPRLSLGTVYRNLEYLVQANLIAKVQLGAITKFEQNTQPHYHVICLSCGQIANLDTGPATDIEDFFRHATNYRLTTHELTLYGLCPTCQKKR